MAKSSSYTSSKPVTAYGASREQKPFFSPDGPRGIQTKEDDSFFQAKLSIGQPNDKFEKEADSVADKVVSKKDGEPAIQRQDITSIQRLATPMEDENFSTTDQRMKRDRELREKPEVQQKSDHCGVASDTVTRGIDNSRGKGDQLPGATLAEMGSSFGTDFSNVNIHTGADAIAMNKELGAQAFTHGNDIYFNSGKFNPGSSTGKHLLAHELTHVVQQEGSIQRKEPASGHQEASTPRLTAVPAGMLNDGYGEMTTEINWELSGNASDKGGFIVQEVTLNRLVFDCNNELVIDKHKNPLHYFEAWQVLPNSQEVLPANKDGFHYKAMDKHQVTRTYGAVSIVGVARYHDNVSPEEIPSHMVRHNRSTVAGMLLSSTHDPKLGGNVSAPILHALQYHWNSCSGGDNSNVVDTKTP
jgi:hypothetical protein